MSKLSNNNLKMSHEGHRFLSRMKSNIDLLNLPKPTYPETLEIIAKFFKNNNEEYIKMINTRLGDTK